MVVKPKKPYIIYGTITLDGVIVSNSSVVIENLSAHTKATTTTDSGGRYIYNLNKLKYTAGDRIRVLYHTGGRAKEHFNIFTAGLPEERLINLNITSIAEKQPQFGATKVYGITALEQIRELFGLSSEITEERKIKKSISSEILVNYTYNNNIIGKVYDDVYKESNISAMAILSYPTLESKIYGNLHNPLEKNYDIHSLIYNNILKKITRGFIIQDSIYNSNISGQLLDNIRKSDSLIGNIHLDKLKTIRKILLLGRF